LATGYVPSDRALSSAEAWAEADHQTGGGRERVAAIVREFAGLGGLVLRTFGREDQASFLSIACLENDDTREVTEGGPRTIGVVAARLKARFGSFRGVVSATPVPGRLNPLWFAKCAEIEEAGFDWAKFNGPWLVPACPSERRESADTELYVWEGVHSSLALAMGLITGSITWQPLDAVVSLRRPAPGC
jgi:hypothetical protein